MTNPRYASSDFSRAGCAAAVEQVLDGGLRLTTAPEQAEIRRVVEERCAALPDEDLRILGYHEFVEGLARGVAAHHAGMLPTFKEVVEELFARGLVRVVFATETLALGINMPARSVVIEKLTKWNGETHAEVTAGEYTQLTGRAGRRGIDVEGHGVVLWQPGLDPTAVAGLASTRTYPLRSSFRPSYNMAVNLVRQVGRPGRGDRLAGAAAPRGRDLGAGRALDRTGGDRRPRDALGPRWTAADGADHGTTRPPPVAGRLQCPGRRVDPDAAAQVVQRPQPTGPARPGVIASAAGHRRTTAGRPGRPQR